MSKGHENTMDCGTVVDVVYDIRILTCSNIFFYILFREYITDTEK